MDGKCDPGKICHKAPSPDHFAIKVGEWDEVIPRPLGRNPAIMPRLLAAGYLTALRGYCFVLRIASDAGVIVRQIVPAELKMCRGTPLSTEAIFFGNHMKCPLPFSNRLEEAIGEAVNGNICA